MDRIKLVLLGLCVSSLTVACGADDIDSQDIKTDGVRAEYTVLQSEAGEGTQATAKLIVNSSDSSTTYLDFTGEDAVTVATGEESVTLEKETVNGDGKRYVGDLTEEGDDAEFLFSFNRGPEDDDAPNSVVTLPPAFELEGLEDNGEVSRASDLVLTWDAPKTDDKVRIHVEGDCIFSTIEKEDGDNDGSVTIHPEDMDATASGEAETCGAKLYVELVRKGTIDPAFGEGLVEGIRRRWISFVSAP